MGVQTARAGAGQVPDKARDGSQLSGALHRRSKSWPRPELAVGFECVQGLVLGVVGYDYRQLNGDSGSGDPVGPFRGSLDAIGPGLSYTTIIDKRPVTFNLRYYHDYDFDKHFHGDTTIASATVRF